ncbi:MAG: hypothetical protein U1F46_17755 [Marinagarivorans sp.]
MIIALVIGLTLAIVLGPLLMLKPTSGLQRIARLRQKAAQMGLLVQAHQHPAITTEGEWMFYLLPWPSFTPSAKLATWALLRKNFSHDIHLKGQWDFCPPAPSQLIGQTLKTQLENLPEHITGIESTSAGVGVYWNERGGERQLALIYAWLDDLVSSLALQPHSH